MEPRSVLGVDEINLSDVLFWARPLEEREGAFATTPPTCRVRPWVCRALEWQT